jgi:hypothetical protein
MYLEILLPDKKIDERGRYKGTLKFINPLKMLSFGVHYVASNLFPRKTCMKEEFHELVTFMFIV